MGYHTAFIKRAVAIALLLFLCGQSWYAVQDIYRTHKEDIILQLADIAQGIALPYHMARLAAREPLSQLPIPLAQVELAEIADTWNAARSDGRTHEGVDIFAEAGTPVFSSTEGYVLRTGHNNLGGNIVFVMGPGGVRYYYAHLEKAAQGIGFGTHVTPDTVIGFVGNSGNAENTPPHLHFGVYAEKGPVNPYPLLISR